MNDYTVVLRHQFSITKLDCTYEFNFDNYSDAFDRYEEEGKSLFTHTCNPDGESVKITCYIWSNISSQRLQSFAFKSNGQKKEKKKVN